MACICVCISCYVDKIMIVMLRLVTTLSDLWKLRATACGFVTMHETLCNGNFTHSVLSFL